MCGIVGIVATQGVVDAPVLQRMNDLLAHRGPDGEGFLFVSGEWGQLRHSFVRRADEVLADLPVRVALGHRRLAILDLSDRGLQPMGTRDGKTWVVFNGEIYNHRELRSNLESKGHVFCTQTDTEVLLHAYVEFGEGCVAKLDGMFAFVVWDAANGRLFCVRDRLGIKPFYYGTPTGYFAFGSEIKALFGFPQCERQADDDAAVGFLYTGTAITRSARCFGVSAPCRQHTLLASTWRAGVRGFAVTGASTGRRAWRRGAKTWSRS